MLFLDMTVTPNLWQGFISNQQALQSNGAAEIMPVRAVLTDFDGVIGDNEKLMRTAYAKLEKSYKDLPDTDTALKYADNPREFTKQHINKEQKLELFQKGKKFYYETPMTYLDGAVETMEFYENKNLPWAVVSNNMHTRVRWGELGLAQKFPMTPVFENSKKPDTQALENALQQLGLPPSKDTLMVDDGWKGLAAAAKLGLTPVYFGSEAEKTIPKVQAYLKENNLPVPEIKSVRTHQQLQSLVEQGIALKPTQSMAL